jgi:HK97 gp10 family phage protein
MTDIKSQIDEAAKKIDLWGGKTKNALTNALVRGAQKIERQAKINAPKDTGLLSNSIQTGQIESEGENVLSIKVGATVKYAPGVENGTSPHTSSEGSEDFIYSITLWGQRKGMTEGQIYELIQHIRRNGTKPHPFLGPAYYSLIKEIQSDIEKTVKKE